MSANQPSMFKPDIVSYAGSGVMEIDIRQDDRLDPPQCTALPPSMLVIGPQLNGLR